MPIIKRGNIYWLDFTLKGKRHRESLHTSSHGEAKKRAAIRERELRETSTMKTEIATSTPSNQATSSSSIPVADPEDKRPRFDTEEEFRTAFGLFHELTPSIPWKATTAAKDHLDDFGDYVKYGEVHYTRSYPPAFHNMERLSRRSMEAVLCTLFRNNLEIKSLAEHLRKARLERERARLEQTCQAWNYPDTPPTSGDNTPP